MTKVGLRLLKESNFLMENVCNLYLRKFFFKKFEFYSVKYTHLNSLNRQFQREPFLAVSGLFGRDMRPLGPEGESSLVLVKTIFATAIHIYSAINCKQANEQDRDSIPQSRSSPLLPSLKHVSPCCSDLRRAASASQCSPASVRTLPPAQQTHLQEVRASHAEDRRQPQQNERKCGRAEKNGRVSCSFLIFSG